jgi:hypothetical protein
VGDLNQARRAAYDARDAAGRMAEAIDSKLQAARDRGDELAVERLEFEAKLVEIRQAARLASDIENAMAGQSTVSPTAAKPAKSAASIWKPSPLVWLSFALLVALAVWLGLIRPMARSSRASDFSAHVPATLRPCERLADTNADFAFSSEKAPCATTKRSRSKTYQS